MVQSFHGMTINFAHISVHNSNVSCALMNGILCVGQVHVIDQDINENAGTYGRGQLSSLSLYSCTVCEKVFKTLSHMRLHCLVHTDLKPFRCNKCQYTTNTKGTAVLSACMFQHLTLQL